jgi:anti-sigma-K factor RskA
VSHEPFDALVPVYALGALDGADLAQFEAHLPTCAACQASVRDAEDTLARAALSAPPLAPPATAREALVRRIAERRRGWDRGWLRWAATTAVAAAATAAFAAGWVAVRYEALLGQTARETAAVRERLMRDEAALRYQVTFYQDAIEVLRDPTTRIVDLHGRDAGSAAAGRMIWNERAGGRMFVTGLPPAPAGKTYELWTNAGAAAKPAGVFSVDAQGGALHRVPPDRGTTAFEVTLEPEGGAPVPTGPIVLTSK